MTKAPAIEAAVFDLGGVVIDVSLSRTVAAWAEATNLAPEEVRRRLLADLADYCRFERGDMEPDDFRARIGRLLGRPLARTDFDRGWNLLLAGPLPGIETLLARLAGRLRLVLLTNTNVIHAREWRRTCAGLLPCFERVFESYTMGCRKPEPACFRQVLAYLALEPERVACLDDGAENVEAAGRLGMVARLVRGPEEVARALEGLGVAVGE